MPYAIRVRLYRANVLEADTDPDLEPGAPGLEAVETLADSQAALVELCTAMHGPAKLMGFGAIALDAYGAEIRGRASRALAFTYAHGYLVAQRDSVEWWRAQVDIALSR